MDHCNLSHSKTTGKELEGINTCSVTINARQKKWLWLNLFLVFKCSNPHISNMMYVLDSRQIDRGFVIVFINLQHYEKLRCTYLQVTQTHAMLSLDYIINYINFDILLSKNGSIKVYISFQKQNSNIQKMKIYRTLGIYRTTRHVFCLRIYAFKSFLYARFMQQACNLLFRDCII